MTNYNILFYDFSVFLCLCLYNNGSERVNIVNILLIFEYCCIFRRLFPEIVIKFVYKGKFLRTYEERGT